MKISISGEHSLRQLIQCIYEQLLEIEQTYAVNFARRVTIYLTTTDGNGNVVYCRDARGKEVFDMKADGPYSSSADHYDMS